MAPEPAELAAASGPGPAPIGAEARPRSSGRLAEKAATEAVPEFEPALRADRW